MARQADDLTQRYGGLRPTYEAFTTSLDGLIRTLLEQKSIEYFSIEPRTKTLESFEEKIQREDKAGKYEEVTDVTDLAGIRVIAYLQEDCDLISRIIEKEFEIDVKNSVRKNEEIDPDKFGYLSTHYVISIKEDWCKLVIFSPFQGMKAEIQVRTLLQHTWAAIDWKFRYKEEREAPKQLRRRLFRISALLEAADNEFSAVKHEIDALRAAYSDDVIRGKLEIALNNESALAFIDENSIAKSILASASTAGVIVLHGRMKDPATYGRLVGTAHILGINTLDKLEEALQALTPEADAFFKAIYDRVLPLKDGKQPQLYAPAVIRYALMRFASAQNRKLINTKYKPSPGYAEAVAEYSAAHK